MAPTEEWGITAKPFTVNQLSKLPIACHAPMCNAGKRVYNHWWALYHLILMYRLRWDDHLLKSKLGGIATRLKWLKLTRCLTELPVSSLLRTTADSGSSILGTQTSTTGPSLSNMFTSKLAFFKSILKTISQSKFAFRRSIHSIWNHIQSLLCYSGMFKFKSCLSQKIFTQFCLFRLSRWVL